MKVFFSLPPSEEMLSVPIALTIGNFDGLHLGHTRLIESLIETSHSTHTKSAVLTFQNYPKDIVLKNSTPSARIFSSFQKELLLKKFSLDYLFILPFTPEIQKLSPLEFLKFLKQFFHLKVLFLGEDATFGKDRQGTKEFILSLSKELPIQSFYISALLENKEPISSSRIKKIIQNGNLKELECLLGRKYSLTLFLEKGSSLGEKLAFPTFNFSLEGLVCLPYGVYKVLLEKENFTYLGIANVGIAPTLKNSPYPLVEVHLLSETIPPTHYGTPYTITFLSFIRPEQKFKDAIALKEQIALDIEAILLDKIE